MKGPVIIICLISSLLLIQTNAGSHTQTVQSGLESGGIAGSRYLELVDSADRKLSMSQWSQAEELIKKALREEPANPTNALLFSNLGVSQMEQGKYTDAFQSLSIALTRAEGSVIIRTHLARTLIALGREEEGYDELGRILKTDSLNEWALQTRALMNLQNRNLQTDPNLRFKEFRTLSQYYPDNCWGWFGLGVEAEEKLSENFGNNKAVKQEVNTKDDIDNYSSAEEYYKKAFDINHYPEIGFRLSMLLLRQDKISEALKLLRNNLKEHPQNGNLYAAMALAHKKSYQIEESKADLKLARQYGASPEIISWIEAYFKGF